MKTLSLSSSLVTLIVTLCICPSTYYVTAFKILLLPVPWNSHVISLMALGDHLAGRGHEVSVLVGEHFPTDMSERSIRAVRYSDSNSSIVPDYNAMMEKLWRTAFDTRSDFAALLSIMKERSDEICHQLTVENDAVMDRLAKEQFDLAVVDGILFMKCIYLVPHRLRIPWVTYCDLVEPQLVRVPWLPSYLPHPVLPYTEQMTFIERMKNALFTIMFSTYPFFPDPSAKTLQKYRRYGAFENLNELMSKSLLWLVAKDVILDYPRPLMPNMINVGGLTVKRSFSELPSDIKTFIDGAKNGIVLVSFGSMASSFPVDTVKKFTSAFRRLTGYRVIWRLNNVDKVELPENVLAADWLPQNDILAKGRVRLFITHCGNNGQFEAIYHGVPMIGFPFMGDQVHNARRLEYKGFGLSMDMHEFQADELLENIHKILTDRSFKDRVTKASILLRSDRQTPGERATYWIEHVCQFGGAHLRSAGNDLPFYSYLMFDLVAVLLLVVGATLYGTLKLVCCVTRKFRKHQICYVEKAKVN